MGAGCTNFCPVVYYVVLVVVPASADSVSAPPLLLLQALCLLLQALCFVSAADVKQHFFRHSLLASRWLQSSEQHSTGQHRAGHFSKVQDSAVQAVARRGADGCAGDCSMSLPCHCCQHSDWHQHDGESKSFEILANGGKIVRSICSNRQFCRHNFYGTIALRLEAWPS